MEMNTSGFNISDMTDHEFAAWLRKKDSKWTFNQIANYTQFICNKTIVAFVKYKNNPPCRTIFIKNEL